MGIKPKWPWPLASKLYFLHFSKYVIKFFRLALFQGVFGIHASFNEILKMMEDARSVRSDMSYQRFKTINVSMDAGEASFVLPEKLSTSPLFLADVLGDMIGEAEVVRDENLDKVFGEKEKAPVEQPVLDKKSLSNKIKAKRSDDATSKQNSKASKKKTKK